MSLCESGQAKETLKVALGSGGVDKGARKAMPRSPSASIPWPCPSLEELRPVPARRLPHGEAGAGRSHRKRRGRAWVAQAFNDPSSTSADWTLGCIAVGTDAEIERVADWVTGTTARRVLIE